MKTTARLTTTITVLTTLTACGGPGSDPFQNGPLTLPDVSTDCDTEFRKSVQGSYNGQIAFSSDTWSTPEACLWEVEMSVSNFVDSVGNCQIGFKVQSNLVSATPNCSDLDTSGSVSGDYGVDEQAPQWPLALSFRTPQVTDPFKFYAPGKVNQGAWELVFDGRGNATPDQVSGLSGWSGQLVSFSDKPDQDDDGLVGIEDNE